MKTILKIMGGIILACLIAVPALLNRELRSMASVHQVGENKYLYEMEYKAAYDLDDVISKDIDENRKLLSYVISRISRGFVDGTGQRVKAGSLEVNCTSFQAANSAADGFLYGRNYDFFKNPSLVTRSFPKNGYASIAMTDMSHLGYSLEKLPSSFFRKALCLASIYAPVDGMNEKGLCTSIMALPAQAAWQDSGRHVVGTTILMRLWLDRCATVDEALALLSKYDIRHDRTARSGYHYMVADASGACAVVEFDPNDGWKTMIVRKPSDKNHMLVTNHLLSPKYYTTVPDQKVGNTRSRSWYRYETAQAYLSGHDGRLTPEEAQECLSLVHWKDFVWENGKFVEDTQYSNVYDQSALTLRLRSWADYDNTVLFSLR